MEKTKILSNKSSTIFQVTGWIALQCAGRVANKSASTRFHRKFRKDRGAGFSLQRGHLPPLDAEAEARSTRPYIVLFNSKSRDGLPPQTSKDARAFFE